MTIRPRGTAALGLGLGASLNNARGSGVRDGWTHDAPDEIEPLLGGSGQQDIGVSRETLGFDHLGYAVGEGQLDPLLGTVSGWRRGVTDSERQSPIRTESGATFARESQGVSRFRFLTRFGRRRAGLAGRAMSVTQECPADKDHSRWIGIA